MKCCTKTCESPATVHVHWPGQERDMCKPCSRRAQLVADAMGFKLAVSSIAEARSPRCTALSRNANACCFPMGHPGMHFSLEHDEAWS